MRRELKEAAEKIVADTDNFTEASSALAEKLATDKALRLAAAMEIIGKLPKRAGKRREVRARRRLGPHRKPTSRPSAAQRAGAIKAEQAYIATIFDRKLRGGRRLGDVRLHEIRATAEKSAENAVSFFTRGFEDATETIALTMLAKHAVAADPYSKLADVIKPSLAERIFKQAEIVAAERIRDESAKLARGLIEIAQQQELPSP